MSRACPGAYTNPYRISVQPGHEYTKSNVKFALSVLQSEAVKALSAFADGNKETQGKFTIGDEKVGLSRLVVHHRIMLTTYAPLQGTQCLYEAAGPGNPKGDGRDGAGGHYDQA